MSQRLNREQWASAALDALAQGGIAAVAVEPIARTLGVTKGSFYHHFKNRDQLIRAALELWEQVSERATQRIFAAHDTPARRLEVLLTTAFELFDERRSGLLLSHLASSEHPAVAPIMQRVTSARLEQLCGVLEEAGLDAATARERALLVYTAYLGMFQVLAMAPDRVPRGPALQGYINHTVQTLLPPGEVA